MYSQLAIIAGLLLSSAAAEVGPKFVKRDSWGPAVGLGPTVQQIVHTTTTIYPGPMPQPQPAYLFVWLGISNGTGDLIQSILGSYPTGESECSGADADTAWCVSSEVYGNDASGNPNQWVGDLTTADANAENNGVTFNYTLTDASAYTWEQRMTDPVTGTLLSTFTKNSGPMLGWGTALECDDNGSAACAGTTAVQTYVNSTIVLAAEDMTLPDVIGSSGGATYSTPTTSDGGKTWFIELITIPAMD